MELKGGVALCCVAHTHLVRARSLCDNEEIRVMIE